MNEFKQPVSIRVSLTEKCSLRCQYCRPTLADHPAEYPMLSVDQWVERFELFKRVVPISKLRFTGGEPLHYPELLPLIQRCHAIGIPDLALTTNGHKLDDMAHALRDAGLKRVNISLDSLHEAMFHTLTGGRLDRVLSGISAAKDAGLALKINVVVLRGFNDGEVMDLLTFAAREGIPLRFLEMMPIGPASGSFKDLYVTGKEIQESLSEMVRLSPLPFEPGETSRDYIASWPDGSEGRCGFIMPSSDPFCTDCRRLRFSAEGALFGCLAQPDNEKLHAAFEAARSGHLQPLRQSVHRALAVKQRPQRFEDQQAMVSIGG